jgi:hypothetical protein
MPDAPVRELIFEVREAGRGRQYGARDRALDLRASGDRADLESEIRDAVECHFEPGEKPAFVRLHFVRDEVLAL